ncbi:hypothetical protein RZN22_13500 [Bacillaceae bacterium S4-13-58]
MSGGWISSFQNAPNRSRFIANKETRTNILKQVDTLNSFLEEMPLTSLWARGIEPGKGLYGFVRETIEVEEYRYQHN